MRENQLLVRDIIRTKLKRFVNMREQAYKKILSSGYAVPGYSLKMQCINAIRTQLEASKNWNLQANLSWVVAMYPNIVALLPREFHDDPKQQVYRKHMLDLLNYCKDLLNTKPMFSTNKNSHL